MLLRNLLTTAFAPVMECRSIAHCIEAVGSEFTELMQEETKDMAKYDFQLNAHMHVRNLHCCVEPTFGLI